MEVVEVSGSKPSAAFIKGGGKNMYKDEQQQQLGVKRKTLQAVLEQCQRALELLQSTHEDDQGSSSSHCVDSETAELCNLLKFRVESPDFLERLGSIHVSVPQHNAVEEGSSWDVVSENDLREDGYIFGDTESDQESYVLVKQEDIVEGIACFTAAWLFSLNQTKELTPNELQKALSKTFSLEKKNGKLQKAWRGSKVIYNVASWGATAIGIYQNPALFKIASVAFLTSCRVISKAF